MKKLISFILILVMLLFQCPVLLAETTGSILTMSKAKELAVRYSPDIKKQEAANNLAAVNERDAWVSYEQAKAAYENTGGRVDSINAAMEAAKKAYDAAIYANSDGKVILADLKEKVEYNTEKLYLNILNMESNIKMMEYNYKLQADMVKIEILQMDIGLSTKFMLDQQIQKSMELEKQLKSLYDSYKSLKWQMNRSIGREPEAPLQLTAVTFNPSEYENEQVGLEKAKQASLAIKQFNRTVEDKSKEIQEKQYTASDKVERLDLEIKQINLMKDDVEYGIKMSLKSIYEKLYLTQKNLVNNRSLYDVAKQNYENNKLQFELGVIPKVVFDSSSISFEQARANYEKAVYDYYLAAREASLAEKGILLD